MPVGPVPILLASLLLAAACVPAPPATRVGGTQAHPPVLSASPAAAFADTPGVRAMSPERVARRMTVRVRALGCGRVGTASAVAVGRRHLITNRHVIAGADTIEVNYWDGTSARARLESVAVDDDLVLVRVSLRLPTVARIADTDAVEGTTLTIVGFPNGGEQAVSRGELIEYAPLEERPDASPVMRLSAPIAPGNSGGPVLDASGAVIGVVFGIETATGHGLAVPASAMQALLAQPYDGGLAPTCPPP